MSGLPYMPFYPADWLSEPGLQLCSPLAEWLWLRCCLVMHEAEPRGYLRVGPIALTAESLARVVHKATAEECAFLLAELEAAGVFSRLEDGTIFSRRMSREVLKARKPRAPEPEIATQPASGDAPAPTEPVGKVVDRVCAHYAAEMVAVHGLRPDQVPAPSPTVRKTLRGLVQKVDLGELLSDVSAYVRLDDPWLREQGYSLRWLESRRPRLHMMRPRKMAEPLRPVVAE